MQLKRSQDDDFSHLNADTPPPQRDDNSDATADEPTTAFHDREGTDEKLHPEQKLQSKDGFQCVMYDTLQTFPSRSSSGSTTGSCTPRSRAQSSATLSTSNSDKNTPNIASATAEFTLSNGGSSQGNASPRVQTAAANESQQHEPIKIDDHSDQYPNQQTAASAQSQERSDLVSAQVREAVNDSTVEVGAAADQAAEAPASAGTTATASRENDASCAPSEAPRSPYPDRCTANHRCSKRAKQLSRFQSNTSAFSSSREKR